MIAKLVKGFVASLICLTATVGFSDAWVNLLWDKNAETNIAHYNVWQSTTGAYAVLSSPTDNSLFVRNLSTQWQYKWYVTAVNSNALSSSNSTIVTYQQPAQPTLVMRPNTSIITTNTGVDPVDGPWTNISTQVTSFLLEWNTSDGKLQFTTNLFPANWITINVTNTPNTGFIWQVANSPQAFFRIVK